MLLERGDVDLVRATRPLLAERGEVVSKLFYARLFQIAPELRAMFPEDLTEQQRKLGSTLAVAVSSLADWDELAPILASLARRHLAYGVLSQHYPIVAQALLDAFQSLGVGAETLAAWNRALSLIANHMIASAYEPQSIATPRAAGLCEVTG